MTARAIPPELTGEQDDLLVKTYLTLWQRTPEMDLETALVNCVKALVRQNKHLMELAARTNPDGQQEKLDKAARAAEIHAEMDDLVRRGATRPFGGTLFFIDGEMIVYVGVNDWTPPAKESKL